MAESDSGAEKTEEPTAKRLRDAREKGQVARSRELSTLVVLLGSGIGILIFGEMAANALLEVMKGSFVIERAQLFNENYTTSIFIALVAHTLGSLLPFLLVTALAGVIGSTVLSGWIFSVEALQPKFSKMNPISGLKRLVGPQGWMEMGKAIAKFAVIASAGVFVISALIGKVLVLGQEPVKAAIVHGSSLILWAYLAVSLSMILIVAVDAPFQVWNHRRQLKMTKQEVKQENKDVDGSPELKGRIRRVQIEMAMRRMMQEVPDADVVITNPQHYAVAIKYDQHKMRAPIVVAKGVDLVAAEIRRVAVESNVPILSAPPLARAIYFTTELNDEVPEGLYMAVARVLAYIFHLRRSNARKSTTDMGLDDLPIPEDMQYGPDGRY